MRYIEVSSADGIAVLTLNRGKVNAINEELLEQLTVQLNSAANDDSIRGIILTGQGSFFSFGLDVPELYAYSPVDFTQFLYKFTRLYTNIFSCSKPVVAAINGHAIAGGCMLAIACDRRLMVSGKARISLNEITFGSTIFAGSVEMLKYCCGSRSAEIIAGEGAMFSAEEAEALGLTDQIVDSATLMDSARDAVMTLADKNQAAFADIKNLLRGPVAELMIAREKESISRFVDIWYSPAVRESLKSIKIY